MIIISDFLSQLGSRIQNYGYLLAHPSYSQLRKGKGAAELYRLLNKPWFPKQEIQLVLDVGANEGQFVRTSLALMPKVRIYAFEPNPISVKKLQECSWEPNRVRVFPIALGSQQETLPLNISMFSPASSFLKNSEQVITEFPETVTEKVINVKVERLDNVIQKIDIEVSSFLLKIDVQGFEMEVLRGATNIFDRISVIVCEVNLAPLYEQQCNLESIVSFLREYHFRLIDIGSPIRSRNNQEVLYVDLAFIRKE